MHFIEDILSGNVSSILSKLTEDASLDIQSVGSCVGKEQGLKLLTAQKNYLEKIVKDLKVFHTFEDDQHLVIEYDITLNNTFDLPLVVILSKAGEVFSALRTYHSVYPITEGHEYRSPLFSAKIELTEPDEVVNYFKAIAIGSTELTMKTLSFEDDVYFREPAGWRWTHKTRPGFQEHFDQVFANGGVPLTFHNYVFDTERGTFSGEYTCDIWGTTTFKPQAGVSIYDINKSTGKITGIRVYDNVDFSFT